MPRHKTTTAKKPLIPRLTSIEESMQAVSEYLNIERYRDDPYAEDVTPEQLRGLIERIWADAYQEGEASGYEQGRSECGE